MSKGVCLVLVLLALGGCKEENGDGNPAGTSGGGFGGSFAGAGAGAGAGIGGAGVGGAGAGGMGGAGMGGSPTDGCAVANTSAGGPALHMGAIEAMATMGNSCGAISSCHQRSGKAMLVLLGATDLRTLMVDKPSCEVPSIPIVSSMMGDAGLNNSWLWIKLTAPLDSSNNLVPRPEWGTPGNCEQTNTGTFGFRMPWGNSSTMFLAAADLAKIRNWICGGAPGP